MTKYNFNNCDHSNKDPLSPRCEHSYIKILFGGSDKEKYTSIDLRICEICNRHPQFLSDMLASIRENKNGKK